MTTWYRPDAKKRPKHYRFGSLGRVSGPYDPGNPAGASSWFAEAGNGNGYFMTLARAKAWVEENARKRI